MTAITTLNAPMVSLTTKARPMLSQRYSSGDEIFLRARYLVARTQTLPGVTSNVLPLGGGEDRTAPYRNELALLERDL